jgi:hypothetical protein
MLEKLLQKMAQLGAGGIPNLIVALIILIVGWIIALVLAALVRSALRRTKMDRRLSEWLAEKEEEGKVVDVARWVGKGVFYLVMLFVLIAFFQQLNLTLVTEPLNRLLSQVFEYAPRVAGAGALLLLAWLVASVLKFLLSKAFGMAKIDERLGAKIGLEEEQEVPLSKTITDAVYWLVFLLFLPAVLSALALEGLLQPVQSMVNVTLGFLPNLFAAAIILGLGWFAARIVQRIVTNLLAPAGIDQLSERVGIVKVLGEQKLSRVIGLVLYVLILIPVVIAALNALGLESVTGPSSNMLNMILAAFPAIFAAALVVVFSFVIGRLVAGLITNLLTSIGFNGVLVWLGLAKEPEEGERSPSHIAGYLVVVAIMLFAGIEALQLLGFSSVALLVTQFTTFAWEVLLGLVIFGLGLFLANLAAKTIEASEVAQREFLSQAARIAIVVLAGAMGLREMGVANEIINLAFGLALGGIALAAALAFGLGGREVAARELNEWVEKAKTKKGSSRKSVPPKAAQ